MIDSDIIDKLPRLEKEAVVGALQVLGSSGILTQMAERLLARLASGSEQESDEKLLERVRAYRADNLRLVGFQHLCESYRDQNNA